MTLKILKQQAWPGKENVWYQNEGSEVVIRGNLNNHQPQWNNRDTDTGHYTDQDEEATLKKQSESYFQRLYQVIIVIIDDDM